MPGSIFTALLGGICGQLAAILRQSLYDATNLVPTRIATAGCAVFFTVIMMGIYGCIAVPSPWLHWVVNVAIMETAAIIVAVFSKLDTTLPKTRRSLLNVAPRSGA